MTHLRRVPGTGAVLPARDQLADLAARGVSWPWRAGRAADAMRQSAVLVLFGVLDDVPAQHRGAAVPASLDVLLTRRSDALSHHPGQVSFPGGGIDPEDGGAVAAALREAVEETGLDAGGVEILGALAPVPLLVSDNLVHPVLAWWTSPSPVHAADPAETDEAFRAPVADLLDPENRRAVRGPGWVTPAFLVAGHVVWGFTALVLDQLF
ncbi:MAG: CoA pyrophosphatase, partial [Actinomycetota bacterium]|nr:CoA pyrophosphatase [Actinomycetota bacterium]